MKPSRIKRAFVRGAENIAEFETTPFTCIPYGEEGDAAWRIYSREMGLLTAHEDFDYTLFLLMLGEMIISERS